MGVQKKVSHTELLDKRRNSTKKKKKDATSFELLWLGRENNEIKAPTNGGVK